MLRDPTIQVANAGGSCETTIYAAGILGKLTKAGITTWRHKIEWPDGKAGDRRLNRLVV